MKSESEILIFGLKMMMKSDLDFFSKIPLCRKKEVFVTDKEVSQRIKKWRDEKKIKPFLSQKW